MARSVLFTVPGEIMAGRQCCVNPPNLNPSSGAGHVEKLGGLSTYVTGSTHSKLGVLLVSDVYGTQLQVSLLFLSSFKSIHVLFNHASIYQVGCL